MKTLSSFILGGLAVLCCMGNLSAQHQHHVDEKPTSVFAHFESNAPFGLMGDHYHTKHSWMVSYRFMPMHMEGNLMGTNNISTEQIHQTFMVAPMRMKMNMHMIGLMYAPTDKITLIAMGHYLQHKMDLEMRSGMQFSTESNRFGDASITMLYALMEKKNQSLHGITGVSIPSGSIEQRDNTPMSENMLLAYPMQTGSGTWDPFVGLTYLLNTSHFCWGAQAKYKFRTSKNEKSYALGNTLDLNVWTTLRLNSSWSLSSRLSYQNIAETKGADPDLNPVMMPLFDAANSGRQQVSLSGGFNYKFLKQQLDGLQLGCEFGYPLYQQVTGIQMKNGWSVVVGFKYTLGGSHANHHH